MSGPPDTPDLEARLREAARATPLYFAVRGLATLGFTLLYRMRSYDAHKVPRTGACLLASNHQSHLDPPLVSSGQWGRCVHFVAKADLFKSRWFGRFISALKSVPIRQDGTGDVGAIREVSSRLETGAAVLIFPEGSRTFDGKLQPFQRGVWLLMKRCKCPVVPVAVEGCYDAFPRGTSFPRLWGKRVAVIYGDPIPHDELLRLGPEAALARLAHEIETLRMTLRARLRASTAGRYPARGAGDERAAHAALGPAQQ